MILNGVDFGRVWCSSGALGFFGDGYWYHRAFPGLDYSGCTFVSKTTTLRARPGNMRMKADGVTPAELVPSCVKVKWVKGTVLNSVGLSGPGAKALLDAGRWQERTSPFVISFMSVAPDPTARFDELAAFVELLRPRLKEFRGPVALEINYSCPNVGVKHVHVTNEAYDGLRVARFMGVPVIANLSPDVPVTSGVEISSFGYDALSVANTVKFGLLPDQIDWEGLWGMESPLAHLGGGGVSGAPLLPLVLEWGRSASEMGLRCPLILGGGILSAADAEAVVGAGAEAVKLGVIGMLRPWRVRATVRRAAALCSSRTPSR